MKKLVFLFLLFATPLFAQPQTVLNPTKVTFTASTDHNTVVGGVTLVTKYELRHYIVGATSPFQVQDLGKPTPDASNVITANLNALPLSTNQYFAKVAAIGPTGEGLSAASNNYFFVGPPVAPGAPAVTK